MNSPTTLSSVPPPAPAPTIRSRAQLEVLLENIAELHRERAALWDAQEAEIAAVRARYRAPLAEVQNLLAAETSWAEAWARNHRAELGPGGTLATAQATLGFRAEAPRIERASRRWTWSRIAVTLAGLPWGRRYLRVPEPVVDPEALLADLAQLSRADLRAAGMEVVEGEQFFLTPRGAEESAAAPEPESGWREAA